LVGYLTYSRVDIQPPAAASEPLHDDPSRDPGWLPDDPPA